MAEQTDAEREPIRVLVVDDQELFRRGLTMLLAVESGIEVVGEAGDGVEGTSLAASAAPDVVLLDIRMPKRSGIEACLAIKDAVPTTKISPYYKDVENYTDLPPIVVQQIEHFFTHYKDLEAEKWVRVGTWGDAAAARQVILDSIAKAGR